MPKIAIEIVSDLVCPWCFIGQAQLERALAARPDIEAELTFSPFQLDPSTPPEGADLRARLERKYGVDPKQLFTRVEEAAARAGIALDFEKIRTSANTLGAHVLLEHARERGTQTELARALFGAYFLEGANIGDPEVLATVASAHGFTADEARSLVTDEGERARVRGLAQAQERRGVTGVPFFLVEGRYAVPGAQGEETWARVLEQITA